MAEPRPSQVRARFAAAVQQLDEAGLLASFRRLDEIPDDQVVPLGLDYFHQKLACPFLEDESCSIHPDRPLACREYLVTSPAEECADPTPGKIHGVPLQVHTARALRAMDSDPTRERIGWIPLTLALDWAETHTVATPKTNGPKLLEEFFSRLVEKPDLVDLLNPGRKTASEI